MITEATRTDDSGNKVLEIKRWFLALWLAALDDYNKVLEAAALLLDAETKVSISAAEAIAAKGAATVKLAETWQALLDAAYRQAYDIGMATWGRGRADVQPFSAAAQRLLDREKAFAFRFAADLSAPPAPPAPAMPHKGRPAPVGGRSAMYGHAVEGGYARGAVDASPPGYLIWWRLGEANLHCSDCPALASGSPYSKDNLPTTPRSGATICYTKCRCYLVFTGPTPQSTPAPPTLPDPGKAADDREKARPLLDRVEGPKPTPPPGYRLPTDVENAQIQDLRQRMAFANRRAGRAHSAGDVAQRDRWIKEHSQLTGTLIEYEKELGIWAPPTFSDAEILTSADLKAGDVNWMTHLRGIDGTTIHRAQAEAAAQVARAARESLPEVLARLPADGGPVVPDMEDLLRRAGAPEFTFAPLKDSVQWADPQALTEAVQITDPADELVLSIVGLGARDTLRIIPEMIEACAAKPYRVSFGPCDENWQALALDSGVWVEGSGDDAKKLIAEVSRRIGGRGLEVAVWQP